MATVSTHYARSALRGAVAQGFDADQLLLKAGITPEIARQPHGRIHEDQMTRLVKLVWSSLKDEFMGFTKHPCKNGVFALMADYVRHSSNLKGMLERGIEFYNLFTDDIHMRLEIVGEDAIISANFSYPEEDPDHFYQEFWLVIWHRFASWFISAAVPLKAAYFRYAKPEHADEMHFAFPCNHFFEQPDNCIVFNRHFLSLPLTRSQSELARFLERSPQQLLTVPGDDTSLTRRVKKLFSQDNPVSGVASRGKHQPLKLPLIDDVAATLALSTQTLHRKLKQEGTSYQKLKDDFRRDIAIHKLTKEGLAVNQVAADIGYAEPRSFSRAFKGWTGLSPRNYRHEKSLSMS